MKFLIKSLCNVSGIFSSNTINSRDNFLRKPSFVDISASITNLSCNSCTKNSGLILFSKRKTSLNTSLPNASTYPFNADRKLASASKIEDFPVLFLPTIRFIIAGRNSTRFPIARKPSTARRLITNTRTYSKFLCKLSSWYYRCYNYLSLDTMTSLCRKKMPSFSLPKGCKNLRNELIDAYNCMSMLNDCLRRREELAFTISSALNTAQEIKRKNLEFALNIINKKYSHY
mgnify:CR=1 FL=1